MRGVKGALAGFALVAAAVMAPTAYASTCSVAPAAYSPPGAPGTDPLGHHQWGLEQIKVRAAWDRGLRGQGVTVAVLDTGVDTTHPDLAPNLLPGADLVQGTACAHGDASHGSAVAGVVAAAAGNGHGISGVAPEARILPLKVNDPGTTAIDNDAIHEALRLAAARRVQVVNMSFGGWSHVVGFDETYQPEIEAAWKAGAVLVATAGNMSLPICSSPAIKPYVICVASTDRRGLPAADYSQFPVRPDGGLGLRAPGGAQLVDSCEDWVVTTVDPRLYRNDCGFGEGWASSFGTSFAAPHVAGLAALLASAGLTNEQIVERLRTRSSNNGTYDPVWGHGLIDADRATEGLSPQLSWPPPAGDSAPSHESPRAAPPQAEGPQVSDACLAAVRQRRRADAAVRAARQRLVRARRSRAKREARRILVRRKAAARRAAGRERRLCAAR